MTRSTPTALSLFLLCSSIPPLASALVGCGGQEAETNERSQSPASPSPESSASSTTPEGADDAADAHGTVEQQAELMARANRFGFDLYRQLRGGPGNVVISPVSAHAALTMTYAGAHGETRTQMASALELDADDASVHAVYGAALRTWNGTSSATLRVADRLYAQTGLPLQEPFLAITRDDYDAALELLDFGSDPERARGTINEWVASRTERRITELLPSGALTPLTRLVLTNAVYFKGTWQTPFDPAQTEPRAFFVQSIAESNVDAMRARGRFAFGESEGVQVLELPYAGDELSMLLLLPSERGERALTALEDTLSERTLRVFRAATAVREVEVQLPRFRLEPPSSPLSGALQALGMRDAFRESADFRGIAGPESGLYLAEVFHKAFIEVNEEGTEAAAATGVVVATRSARPAGEPARFIADHPFLFLVIERRTGAILFLGRVSDPR